MPEDAVLETPELETPDIGGEELETPETETPEGEATNLGDEPETEGEEGNAEGEGEAEQGAAQEVTPDGRKMPDGLKKAIASLKATSPEAAKQIKGLYYSEQAYREVFAKPEEAVAAKTLIEEIGGAEGIQQIQAERQEWNEIDQAFAEGRKEFVASLAESSPEGFLKTAPHVINEFAARAPEQYQYYANNVALNTLQAAGITIPALASAYARYSDKPEAQAIIAEVHNALVGLKEKATEFEQKRSAVDPEREKFQQEKTQFEQQRRADFEGRVADQAIDYLKGRMQPEIDRILAGRKIDDVVMQDYRDKVKAEVERRMGEIPGFADKLEAHYRSGDSKKSFEFIKSKYDGMIADAAKVITPFVKNIPGGKVATNKPPVANGTGKPASAGEVVLKEMPDWNQFDQSKTTVADVMQGFGILKNGKRASGWA